MRTTVMHYAYYTILHRFIELCSKSVNPMLVDCNPKYQHSSAGPFSIDLHMYSVADCFYTFEEITLPENGHTAKIASCKNNFLGQQEPCLLQTAGQRRKV